MRSLLSCLPVAILSALIAWLGRQLSNIVQAILGWSVTALFGRLPSTKQTALSVALLVSLLWPILVLGVVFPAVSAWALAMVPVHKWIGNAAVRWVSVALAVSLPWAIGGVTRWVAPSPRSSTARAVLLSGYPLTIGYAVACVVTAVTVPLVRLASAMRGWHDEHVYLQPRPGQYDRVLEELARACAVAEVPVAVEPVPARLLVATRVLERLARAAVAPIVAEQPKRLRGDRLEIYLYPADLLLRGVAADVARVRAALTRGWVERHAYVVSDPGAQRLEEEIQRMWDVLARHPDRSQIGGAARARLAEIARELDRTALPFDQWIVLDRSLHRVERALVGGECILHDDVAVEVAPEQLKELEERAMAEPVDAQGEPTPQLMREAFDEVRELVRLEVAMARQEVQGELTQAKAAGIALGAGAALAIAALTMFLVAIAAAFKTIWLAALIIGGIVLLVAGALGYAGWKAIPRRPLAETKERVETDLKQLRERTA